MNYYLSIYTSGKLKFIVPSYFILTIIFYELHKLKLKIIGYMPLTTTKDKELFSFLFLKVDKPVYFAILIIHNYMVGCICFKCIFF